MRYRQTLLLLLVPLFLACAAGCNRSQPTAPAAGPEAALERAWRAGVLTKDEYDAKKAALHAPPPAPVPAPASPAPVPPAPAAAAPVEPAIVPAPAPPVQLPPKPATRSAPARRPAVTASASPPPPAQPPAAAAPPPAAPTPVPPAVAPAAAADPGVPKACEDAEIRPGKEKGKQEHFFPMPAARVRAAASQALAALEFQVHSDQPGEIEASKKRHIGVVVGSGGERIVLTFQEAREGGRAGTLVVGETKKNILMRAGQKSWTHAVFTQMSCLLRPKN